LRREIAIGREGEPGEISEDKGQDQQVDGDQVTRRDTTEVQERKREGG